MALVAVHSSVLTHFFEQALRELYEPIFSASYEEVIERAKMTKIDLIIVDERLSPEGIKACLQTLRRMTDVPILVITGSLKKGHHRQLLLAGASNFLTEPLDPVEIQQEIRKVNERHKATSKVSKVSLPFIMNAAATQWIQSDCSLA